MSIVSVKKPSQAWYGESIGILILDASYPCIPGNIGNASTFPFAIRYEKVQGASKGLPSPPGIVQYSTGIVYSDCIKRLREDQTIKNAVEAVYASHEDFENVTIMHIENSFKAVPDKTRWAEAVEGMAKKFAGVKMSYPMVHLENWLAGKPESSKDFKSTLGE